MSKTSDLCDEILRLITQSNTDDKEKITSLIGALAISTFLARESPERIRDMLYKAILNCPFKPMVN